MTAAPGFLFVVIGLCIAVPFCLLLGGGMYLCWRGIRKAQKQKQELAEAPLVKIKELGGGLHKVKGRVSAQEELLRSPLTKTKCAYYRFHVEELRVTSHYDGKHTRTSRTWVTIVDDKKWIDFTITDKTGEVDIDMDAAEVTLNTKAYTHSGTFDGASPELEDLMRRRYGKSTKGLIFNKDLRYKESFLREGDKILVVGDVRKKKGQGPEFFKGGHHLVLTDMEEAELRSSYTTKTIWLWVVMCILGLFMLAACGAGGFTSLIGLGLIGVSGHIPTPPSLGKKDDKKSEPKVAKPRPINPGWNDAKMTVVWLSDMQEQNPKVGWGKFGKNGKHGYQPGGHPAMESPILVQGKPQTKAISMHPPDRGESSVQYRLGRQYKLFRAQIALHDLPQNTAKAESPQVFKIFGDGELLWSSDRPIQNRGDIQDVRISVENVDTLELRVHCGGGKAYAWSVWVNPCVLR